MPRYSEADAREAVAASLSYSEALRRLDMRPAGGNHRLFKKWVARWGISTDHFDPHAASREVLRNIQSRPTEEYLVENSSISRHSLKLRLYREGLKQPVCEICSQGEIWRGEVMAMILDHINGVPDDNRIENLRIVCPNCAATLDTHCGRKNRNKAMKRPCEQCGRLFISGHNRRRWCSQTCAGREKRRRLGGVSRPERRKVARPPFDELVADIRAHGCSAVARKYGVSDNAIRKWVRQYQLEQEREAAA
jgi:transposase-like protein